MTSPTETLRYYHKTAFAGDLFATAGIERHQRVWRRNPKRISLLVFSTGAAPSDRLASLHMDYQNKKMERRLAAILVADAVGFSALVGRDEEAAINTLKGHFAVLEPVVALNLGRIFKNTGDGFLAEFASVVDAVACANAMQQKIADRNAQSDQLTRIDFRIGVHSGEVVVDGEDILGDGVNVAARLEAVSPVGGVAVSARVRDDIIGKLDAQFEDIGLVELKNIKEPVHVFVVGPGENNPEGDSLDLPSKPSIAVLPFKNNSSDEDAEYFADGIVEDITVALAQVPWVFVIARDTSYLFKGLSVDPRRIGRELGVRYLLQGSIRRSGDRIRISAELVEAETANTVWAKRFDGTFFEVFELQDEVSEAVVTSIAPKLESAEINRVLQKPARNHDAYDMYLRGQHALHLGRIESADKWFEKSLKIAPDFSRSHAKKGWLATMWHYFGENPAGELRSQSVQHARAALELEPDDPEVLAYAGYTIGFLDRSLDFGLELVEKATEASPSFAWAWTSSGMMSAYKGMAEQSLERAAIALRLSPRDPLTFRNYIAISLASIINSDFEALLESGTNGANHNPRPINFHYHRAIALAHLGRMDEALAARDRVLEIDPGFRIAPYIAYCRDEIGISEELNRPLEDGLLAAGFPK